MGNLDGQVAFITGAARGQGRAHAVKLASEGADIIAVDLCAPVATAGYDMATEADLAQTVALVEAQGRRIVASVADTRDLDALKSAVDAGVEKLGRLDIVIANAGIAASAKLSWDLSAEEFR
ncbi:SDR family NAD(P)-dependent oxidoreductase, partial [Rhodococcus erythropolis]